MSGCSKLSMLTLLVGGFIHLHEANADTIQAASCSQDDVQKAIDAATDGDVVEVPAGTATWTTTSSTKPAVSISDKTITLEGAGIDKTIIIDGTGHAWKDLLLWISGAKPSRITGFTFKGFIEKNRGAAQGPPSADGSSEFDGSQSLAGAGCADVGAFHG